MKTFKAAEGYVKKLGRTHEYGDALWLALSGSGAEFSFYGKKAQIALIGDDTVGGTNNFARIGITVNGQRVVDDLMNEARKVYTVFDSDEQQEVTIGILKLSEAAMSTVGIWAIAVDAEDGIRPTPGRSRRIEFIGDSITCGYGIDDEDPLHAFSTATEDVTGTYAYLTAEALDADYSMVSYSGYGLISGYTENGEKLLTHLVPDYYAKWAKSEGRPGGTLNPLTVEWDFSRFVPDLIVINLGTNDDSYAQSDLQRQAEFAERYAAFLQEVRSRSAEAPILCTLGIMGDRLYPLVEQAVKRYVEATGDTSVSTLRFDVQRDEDGRTSDYHPTRKTHIRAAGKLTERIRAEFG
ncbi:MULTISPECIES: SGNH/GDSL hydrolase family protein [Saccharibacillus]|uniref:SGNH/GDSL hydrolase family protein n=1 Tax=Saccharibacillus TaxID=456492 RepID=UPI00123BE559|nr:SGNH/GDSL hydrolase family protein [Saccharibacillus sp. WB 17]MWJ32912.1 GDSL family lipase [Saccharibacillus sp. WB 17]